MESAGDCAIAGRVKAVSRTTVTAATMDRILVGFTPRSFLSLREEGGPGRAFWRGRCMPARLLRYGDQSTAASAARKWDIRTMPIAHTERDEGPEPRAFTRSPRVAIPDAPPETRVPTPRAGGLRGTMRIALGCVRAH